MSDTVTTEEPRAKPGPTPKKPEGIISGQAATDGEVLMVQKDRQPIPVSRIRLKYGERVDLPGKEGANALDDNRNEKHKAKRWAIDYLPGRRQVRVRHWNGDAKMRIVLIPDVWVMMEVEE